MWDEWRRGVERDEQREKCINGDIKEKKDETDAS